MNPFLNDIFSQPVELQRVLRSLLTQYSGQVRTVAKMLESAEEIVLTSMGSAYYSLIPMYYALLKRGMRVRLVETSELLRAPAQLSTGKLYLLMSRSGESYEIAQLPLLLKSRGLLSVGITMTPESTMAKNVSVVLHDCSSYDALICTKAYSTMALCGLACVSAIGACPTQTDELVAGLEKMFKWMEENKEAVLRQIESIPFLRQAPNFYFLSRGCGMGVVKSASLWLEEASRKCGNVSSLDNFYHGPIELSKTQTVPVFLDVDPDERSAMIWETICGYTQTCVYVGPQGSVPPGCFTLNYPVFSVPEEYNMLLLALYFQLFAYQCALTNGLEPGKLETVSWVVK